ncbi:hypothetical protein TcCL_NonESM02336 [Trypanosoma cruzi]|uniref:Uncharacterized protein n=1 Tax=Trypanosoma cruzi (strain CL Brener) TaxID=353153 RepID=Q4E2Z5_TRYCC|nr:hypothetical protein Tc00.1047053506435.460 [Trypanosoma cruzi]EAN99180.1 hypothetical protein Tc00.1047053506435.460 [Trypanosoma cruzi]RNC47743.1 hypothetical protein TcCL_NonESM02336 [Trypanosoma cruzi]|eukprot:XP_821031.1 hypothetical protein [Trypanosoma cruzi strain CL Brener]
MMLESSSLVERENENATQASVEMLRQELIRKQAEIDSLRLFRKENNYLREKVLALSDRVDLLTVKWTEPATSGEIALRAQLLAYQRHSRVHQEELDRKEETIVELQGKVEQQEDELLIFKRRCEILFGRLCTAGAVSPVKNREESTGVGTPGTVFTDEDDPTSFWSLIRKLRGVEMELDTLRERFVSLQEDYERRGVLVAAMRRENAALRASVSQLIQQVRQSAALQLGGGMENGATKPQMEAGEQRNDNAVDAHPKLFALLTQKEEKLNTNKHGDSQGE